MFNVKITDRVKYLLQVHPDLRDDDNRLIANVWKYDCDYKNMTGTDFLKAVATGSLTTTESIRRTRQKLQEEYPHLRGKRWKHRQRVLEPMVRQEVLDFPGGYLAIDDD